ncbi:C4-type zinc ribbon domain-containing protein [candidate division KSB1 bacterium]|nr:C4-type zinc ribbon domain-containing protein [candidate division KSB1 bacterium]
MDLFKLIKLQEIDKRIMELESLKGDIPEQVESLRDKLAIIQHNLATSANEFETAKKSHRNTEMEIKLFTDKLNKYKEQLYSVRTNKEYDAITSEIENLEKKIDEIEIQGVEALENEEKYGLEVAQYESQQSEVKQFLTKKEFELQEKLDESAAEQQILNSQRQELVSGIDRRDLSNYDRISRGRNGIALAEIHNYVCNACFATIPAQTVVEVRKMERLIYCETCGRILVAFNNVAEQPIEIN